jgi:hypothetical protein
MRIKGKFTTYLSVIVIAWRILCMLIGLGVGLGFCGLLLVLLGLCAFAGVSVFQSTKGMPLLGVADGGFPSLMLCGVWKELGGRW